MQQAILKSKEVNDFLNMGEADLPPCEVRTIKQLEEKEFRDCIGSDFYDLLFADLVDYSAAEQYVSGEYAIGDNVVYKGRVYQSTAITSDLPTNVATWKRAPKFQEVLYEELWCSYLGEYLSWVVYRGRLPFMRSQTKGGTIVTTYGSDFNAASDQSYSTLQKTVNIRIAIVFENMDVWIKAQDESVFEKYKGIESEDCSSKGKCSCGNNCLRSKKKKTHWNVA